MISLEVTWSRASLTAAAFSCVTKVELSYINADVLLEADIRPESFDVARLSGYDIVIQPRASFQGQ